MSLRERMRGDGKKRRVEGARQFPFWELGEPTKTAGVGGK